MKTPVRLFLRAVGCAALVMLAAGGTAWGQYIFADANGDGQANADDRMKSDQSTSVDIYVVTDRNRDGSAVAGGSEPLSIFSYEFVLAAVGGTIKWGAYTNTQPTMDLPFGRLESETEIYIGFGGYRPLPPGKHKLGTLSLEAKSGRPSLEFRSRSSLRHLGGTSFGSRNPGKDGDHTLKFTQDRARLRAPSDDLPGDWADADGLAAPDFAVELAAGLAAAPVRRFEVLAGPNPSPALGFRLTISTTKPGRLVVRLFDVQGRLVSTLRSDANTEAGTYSIPIQGGPAARGLATGIYLYRVETADGTRTGRVVLLD